VLAYRAIIMHWNSLGDVELDCAPPITACCKATQGPVPAHAHL